MENNVVLWLMFIAFLAGVVYLFLRAKSTEKNSRAQHEDSGTEAPPESAAPAPAENAAENMQNEGDQALFALTAKLDEFYKQTAYPADLLRADDFHKGVTLLMSPNYSKSNLLAYYSGVNVPIACMALEALRQREDTGDILESVFANVNISMYWVRYFVLRYINLKVTEPVIGRVLSRVNFTWTDPVPLRALQEFLTDRMNKGEKLTFGDHLADISSEQAEEIEEVLGALGEEFKTDLLKELKEWRKNRIDTSYLKGLGRVLFEGGDDDAESGIIEHHYLLAVVKDLENSLTDDSPRSVLLVGESGVGKTTMTHVLGKRMAEKGWIVFEAGAAEILAGQSYIGELEERVLHMIENMGRNKKVVWIAPNLHQMMWAGTHRHSRTSLLDLILPFVERGELMLVGETQPLAFEQMKINAPRVLTALDSFQIDPLPKESTILLAQQWFEKRSHKGEAPGIAEEMLQEALHLTQQYMGDKAAPGNLLQFMELTWSRLSLGSKDAAIEITIDDMLVTLSRMTGLPNSILDERQGLDLDELRAFFHEKVLGQSEAIDCLVERVAMIKAGLTDPTRPQGVFLFAGPTGTGKTEIAKRLAEFVFGSARRMIRLDMSEFQNPDSLDRILGDTGNEQNNQAVVNLIRKQPFSVVLLDEFEKAAANVWDLFLQVFDDGRLTDRRGNTADFRHCIIIMTSNLGGVIPSGAGIGFTDGRGGFTPGTVARAIETTFRKEFINRIDRMIVFHPLSRSVMREVLKKELGEVMKRRGLRNRDWAVEWHDSATEFLLDKGFTVDLGARPLKRAIERYLLSPLAMTIVNHQFPEGDQFLFVRSNGKEIEVEFIDPDAPDPVEAAPQSAEDASGSGNVLQLQSMILDPQGTAEEAAFLNELYAALQVRIENEDWELQKQSALAQMSNADFWNSPDRFATLGIAEYMDRIETGFATAGRLLNRMMRPAERKKDRISLTLVQRLAQQLYLIDAACNGLSEGRPQDAFVLVEAGEDPGTDIQESNAFAKKIANMYQQWAEKRRMRHRVLSESGGDGNQPYRMMMAIAGYAAFGILEAESGFHVLEIPGKDRSRSKSFLRCKTHVHIVAQPDTPAEKSPGGLLKQATAVFAAAEDVADFTIVRRYREHPSPLVRDSIKNWRSGRLDRVLAGDFDLIV